MRNNFLSLLRRGCGIAMAATLTVGCTNIDCPLDNVVAMTCGLYDAGSRQALTLEDSLTVSIAGSKDTVLLNKAIGMKTFQLPLRYTTGTDTLLFRFSSATGQSATDTLFVSHTAAVHFDKPDCPAGVYHQLVKVRHTSHPLALMPLTIDSVFVSNHNVTYEDLENLRIYLRAVVEH